MACSWTFNYASWVSCVPPGGLQYKPHTHLGKTTLKSRFPQAPVFFQELLEVLLVRCGHEAYAGAERILFRTKAGVRWKFPFYFWRRWSLAWNRGEVLYNKTKANETSIFFLPWLWLFWKVCYVFKMDMEIFVDYFKLFQTKHSKILWG